MANYTAADIKGAARAGAGMMDVKKALTKPMATREATGSLRIKARRGRYQARRPHHLQRRVTAATGSVAPNSRSRAGQLRCQAPGIS